MERAWEERGAPTPTWAPWGGGDSHLRARERPSPRSVLGLESIIPGGERFVCSLTSAFLPLSRPTLPSPSWLLTPFRIPSHTPFVMGARFSLGEFLSSPCPVRPGLPSLQHIPLPVSASLIIAPFTFPGSGAGHSNRGDL